MDILKSSGEGDKTCVEGQQIVTYRINHIKTCWVTFTGACYAMYRKSILISCVSDIQRPDSHPLKMSSFNVTGYTLVQNVRGLCVETLNMYDFFFYHPNPANDQQR